MKKLFSNYFLLEPVRYYLHGLSRFPLYVSHLKHLQQFYTCLALYTHN